MRILGGASPDEVTATFLRGDLESPRFRERLDWDWWLRISAGTRSPVDAARRIRRGEVPGGNPDEDEPIARRLQSADPPPELIVVARPDRSKLVVVEGHVRLTAYALFPEVLPDELEILLGVADEIERWSLF